MARQYTRENTKLELELKRHNLLAYSIGLCIASFFVAALPIAAKLPPIAYSILFGIFPAIVILLAAFHFSQYRWIENERLAESARRGGKAVLGMPPQRQAFEVALKETKDKGKLMIDRYLVGFEVDSGEPIWVNDDDLCGHGCVFAKTGVGKTLWLEGLMFQQMARGRASGFTFIDAKRDPGTLADIIMMALITGRIEDLIVVDPFDPVCAYNFVFTTQRPDVKARKVLRCGLPPTSDQSSTKHYDRLAADAVYRVVRAMESLGLAWSVRDVAVALSAFNVAYPRMRELLHEQGAKQAMVELGHLASSYRTGKGSLDMMRLTDNLRGIASELHSISNSEAGEMFCAPRADLSLTDAILRGKLIYYMLPRLEEAESAARMVKVFREDLEVSIGEVTSSRNHRLEDPHMVIIDEGSSTFGPTWANLFELARKGRFALLFGAQSVGGLMDEQMGLSEQFYERVIANVNLKVIMRIGDNRTAEDMCEWIGKIATTKKSLATGVSTSLNARELTKHLEFNKRTADGFRDAVTVSEDEEDLVSAEELKHEMSAEKGLAWFDKGDGRLRKGRSIWFDSELPATWEGREFLTRYESVEADEIGLAEWVDEHILSVERAETERSLGGDPGPHSSGPDSYDTPSRDSTPDDSKSDGSPYRFNLMRGFRGVGKAKTYTAPEEKPSDPVEPAITEQKTKVEHNSVAARSEPPQAVTTQQRAVQPGTGQNTQGRTVPSANPESRPKAAQSSGLSFGTAKGQSPRNGSTNKNEGRPPTNAQRGNQPRDNLTRDNEPRGNQQISKPMPKQNENKTTGLTNVEPNKDGHRAPQAAKSKDHPDRSGQGQTSGGSPNGKKLTLKGSGKDTVTTGNKLH